MRARLPWILGAAVAAAFLFLFRDVLAGGRLPMDAVDTNDVSFVGTAYEQWAVRVRDGRLPLWFPEFDGGMPLAAAWMYGLLHPGLALFVLLPVGTAWAWTAALHAGLGAAGMAAFLRRRGADDAGVVAGAVLFAVSEHFVGRATCGHLNLVVPLAWAPWVLVAVDRAVRGERFAVPVLGLVAASAAVSGHVQVWVYLAPLVAAYGAALAWERPGRAAALRRLAGGTALAAGIAAVQIAITAEMFACAAPVHEDPEIVRQVSVPWDVLLGKLVAAIPGPLPGSGELDFRHEYRGIAGLWAFGLAAWAVARGAPQRWLWAGFALAGLVASMGTRTPLTAWMQDVPPFSLARSPGRFLILPLVCVPVLAAHAPVLRGASRFRFAAAGAVAALAVVAGVPGVRSVSDALHREDWSARLPAEFRGHRVHSPELTQLSNVERTGLDSLRALCFVRTRGWAEVMAEPSAATAWWLDLGAELKVIVREEAPYVPSIEQVRVEIVPYEPMGRARFFGDAAFGVADEEALRRIRGGERTLFLDGPAGAAPGSRAAGSARVVAAAPDRVEVRTDARGAGWVVVSMKRYPGWTAEVDGEPAAILRGSVAFPAVRVPEGAHTVVLTYRPWSFRVGAAVSAAALALSLLLVLRERRVSSSA